MRVVKCEVCLVGGVEARRLTYSDGTNSYSQRIRTQFGHYVLNTVKNPDYKRRIDTAITVQGIRAARQESKHHG